jgi:hypothetical protein
MKKILGIFIFLFSSIVFAQDISRDEMISYMKKIVRNKEFVEKAISSYKTEGYVKESLRYHFNEVYKSDELIVRMVDEIINSRMLDANNLNSTNLLVQTNPEETSLIEAIQLKQNKKKSKVTPLRESKKEKEQEF